MWVDLPGPSSGVVRAYSSVNGNEFVTLPMGIRNRVFMEPRRAMEFDDIDVLTRAVRRQHVLAEGQRFELSGHSAFLLKGRFR